MKKKLSQNEKKLSEYEKKLCEFEKMFEFIKVDKEVIDFSEQIITDKKNLITIGLLETIKNKNHEYKFPDLQFLIKLSVLLYDKTCKIFLYLKMQYNNHHHF